MWTFAHVVSAVLFGALTWYVSEFMIEPMFPEGFDPGWFAEVNAAIAAICGWKILGRAASRVSFAGSISLGFSGIIVAVFAALFLQSSYDMILRSLQRQYDGPAEAVTAVFELLVEHLFFMSTPEIWGVLLGGGIVTGIVAGIAGRVWR